MTHRQRSHRVGAAISPRWRMRPLSDRLFSLGRTSGAMEAILAGVLLALSLLVEGPYSAGWGAATLSGALCVAAGLSGRWPLVAGATVGVLLSILAILPPEWSGLAVHACLVPIIASASRGRVGLKWALSTWYLVALVAHIAATTGLAAALVPYVAGWAALIGIALVIGTAFRFLSRFKDAERRSLLRQQRHAVARDIHDTVAHELSLTVMRVEQAQLRGDVKVDDLGFVLDSSRKAVRDLRRMMEVLRENDDEPRSYTRQSAAEALQRAVQLLERLGFSPRVTVEGDISGLSGQVDDTLGWVLVEAASNIARHGDPDGPCTILIDAQPGQLGALVTNRAGKMDLNTSRHGMGLVGMRERLAVLDGTLFVSRGENGLWITQAIIPT